MQRIALLYREVGKDKVRECVVPNSANSTSVSTLLLEGGPVCFPCCSGGLYDHFLGAHRGNSQIQAPDIRRVPFPYPQALWVSGNFEADLSALFKPFTSGVIRDLDAGFYESRPDSLNKSSASLQVARRFTSGYRATTS